MSDTNTSYKEYLESYAWKALKKMKLEEQPDCEVCGKPATTVHHLSYERRGSEKPDDIVSICEGCHHECHHVGGYQIKNDEEVLRRRFEEVKGDDAKDGRYINKDYIIVNWAKQEWFFSDEGFWPYSEKDDTDTKKEQLEDLWNWYKKNNINIFKNGEIINWINSESFEIIDEYFVKDRNYVYEVYHDFNIINEADSSSFAFFFKMQDYPHKSYYKDKNNIYEYSDYHSDRYYKMDFIREYDEVFCSDPNFVHVHDWILRERIFYEDTMSFVHVKNNVFKDKNHIWFLENSEWGWGIFLPIGADIDTFELVDNVWYKDINYLYYQSWNEQVVLKCGVDLNTFNVIDKNFAKDKNYVYDLQYFAKIEWADSSTFEVLNDLYSKDNNHVYYRWNWTKTIDWADPRSFETLGMVTYAKDSKWIYREWCKLHGVSSDGFEYIEHGIFKNTEHIFYNCSRYLHSIDDIDVRTFKIVNAFGGSYWTIEAEDKYFKYSIYEDSDFDDRDKLIHKFHLIKSKK